MYRTLRGFRKRTWSVTLFAFISDEIPRAAIKCDTAGVDELPRAVIKHAINSLPVTRAVER